MRPLSHRLLVAWVTLPAALFLFSHCDEAPLAELGEGCSIRSNCTEPLICAFEKCHSECNPEEGNRDCGAGERCVKSEAGVGVCLVDTECERAPDCPSPLICGIDGQCRNECSTAGECPAGSVCTDSTCAFEEELDSNGELPDATPGDSEGASCNYTSECEGDLVCRGGKCQRQCYGDVDCADSETCDLEIGRCVGEGGAYCGDGIIDKGELCDDGNTFNADSCTNSCESTFCGDGAVQGGMGEFCDDGNTVDDDACTNACTLPRCGDGVLQADESCDDGNFIDTDDCPNDCDVLSCEAPLTACNDLCVNTQTNPVHCGDCNLPCGLGQDCIGGVCGCPFGQELCDSGCRDTQFDSSNCGDCGLSCQLDQFCSNGQCSCFNGFMPCPNGCFDTVNDPQNCGGCGIVCSGETPMCMSGDCVPLGQQAFSWDIDGRTVSLHQIPSCTPLANLTQFCESRGLLWWRPRSVDDANLLLSQANDNPATNSWVQVFGTVETTLQGTMNGFAVSVSDPTCEMASPAQGWTGFRVNGCSFCEPDAMPAPMSCCNDPAGVRDWFACESPPL